MRNSFICICGEKVFCERTPDQIFECLVDLIGPAEAIEASSWCELASIGEEYDTENVYITLIG